MSPGSGFTTYEALPPGGRVHIVGAGPVGLLLAALLQSVDDVDVRLYEKRRHLHAQSDGGARALLVADSIESYCTDHIDGDNVQAVFDPFELDEAIQFRASIPSDLMTLLRGWTQGFCPLNEIERSLSDLIDTRGIGFRTADVDGRDRTGCDRDARTGRHAGRLHGQQVADS